MRKYFLIILGLFVLNLYANSSAISYLNTHIDINSSSYNSNKLATKFQIISEVLQSYKNLNLTLNTLFKIDALRYIDLYNYNNTLILSNKIILNNLYQYPIDNHVEKLLINANYDGGFGDRVGYSSSIEDTSLALQALYLTDNTQQIEKSINYLILRQKDNGSWTKRDNEDSIYLTALVTHTLWLYRNRYDLNKKIQNAREYLKNQMSSNLWGEIYQSAKVLLALMPLESSNEVFQNSIDILKSLQLPNGSWDNNLYTTSLVLQVLAFAAKEVPNPDLSSIVGYIYDAQTLNPLKGVKIDILSKDTNRSTISTDDGHFTVNGLKQDNYYIKYSLKGYKKLIGSLSLEDGKKINLGDIYLSKKDVNVTTGTLKGILLDASTNEPIRSALISINGMKTYSLENGNYQINSIQNGNYEVKIYHEKYNQVSQSIQINANSIIVFSPKLYKQSSIVVDNAIIFGTIYDVDSNKTLNSVEIVLDGNISTFSTLDGKYNVSTKEYGKKSILFKKDGYKDLNFEIYLYKNAVFDLSPKMYPKNSQIPQIANTSSLNGTVLNSRTNRPISNADIKISYLGKNINLKSDENGSFSLKGINTVDVNISISKENYNTSDISAVLEPLKNLDLGQIRLRLKEVVKILPELKITKIDTNQTATNPHTLEANGTLHVSFANIGNTKTTTPIEFTAFYDMDNDGNLTNNDTILAREVYDKNLYVDTNGSLSLYIKGKSSFLDMPIFVMIDSVLHINELDETNNILSSSINSKTQINQIGKLDPVIKWHWDSSPNYISHVQVMSTPTIGQINDDNGDGKIDKYDIPDVIFVSFSGGNYHNDGVLRVISGKDGKEIWSYNHGFPYHGTAIGDIDHDGKIEIVVASRDSNGLVAFENNGSIKWETETSGRSEPVIADLDADGSAEIIYGSGVFDANGTLLFNISIERLPIVVDLDMDGKLEIVSNGYAYRHDGSSYWQGRKGGEYSAVGNFDDDEFPEIVMKNGSFISLYEHTGERIWGPSYVVGGGGGGITISDVDGDNEPEISIAGANYYIVYETDGSLKWKSKTQDYSSSITGSTVFDFEGDGKAEILYNDEMYFRIYNGENGEILFQMPNTSGTLWEEPVVADIDNDGHAEIVLASNNYAFGGKTGIITLESNSSSWMPTRSIWNQHSYHITNVNDDGSIPQHEKPSWLTHNTYRLNTFVGRDPRSISDLSVSLLNIYDENQSHTFTLRVGNGGDLTSPKSEVKFFKNDPKLGGKLLGTVKIGGILTNEYIDISLENIKEDFNPNNTIYAIVDFDNQINEYKEDNNIIFVPFKPTNTQATIKVQTDKPNYDTNDIMKLKATIKNIGLNPYKLYAKLFIEDKNSSVVLTYPMIDLGTLEKNSSKFTIQNQNASEFLAGTYTLKGELYDKDKKLIQTDKTPFSINVNTGINNLIASLNTITDKSIYSPNDTVVLKNIVQNLSSNSVLDNAILYLHVRELNTSKEIESFSLQVNQLTPKGTQQIRRLFDLINANIGAYEVEGILKQNDKILSTAKGRFEVSFDINQALIGKVKVAKPVLKQDELQNCKDTIKNISLSHFNSLPIKQELIYMDKNKTILQENSTINLDKNNSTTLQRDINTSTLETGNYVCSLSAKLESKWHTLAFEPFLLKKRPISFDLNSSLSDKPRILVLVDEFGYPIWSDFHTNESEVSYISKLLEQNGYSFDIETKPLSFKKSFRSGKYSAYLIFSKTSKLTSKFQRELEEAMNRNDGILIAGKHNILQTSLEHTLGVKYSLKYKWTDKVIFEDKTYKLYLNDNKVSPGLLNATLLAKYYNALYPAITYKELGYGKGIFTSFNLLAYANKLRGEHEKLLLKLISKIHPKKKSLHVSDIQAFEVTLTNKGLPTKGVIEITYDRGLANFVDSNHIKNIHKNQKLVWEYDFSDKNSTSVTFWLDLLSHGDLNITSNIYANKTLYKSQTNTYKIDDFTNLDDLITIAESQSNNDFKWISHLLEKVQYFEQRNNHSFAVYYALECVNVLELINNKKADEIRYKLDFIIKQIERKMI